jgi:hypothetical protein
MRTRRNSELLGGDGEAVNRNPKQTAWRARLTKIANATYSQNSLNIILELAEWMGAPSTG